MITNLFSLPAERLYIPTLFLPFFIYNGLIGDQLLTQDLHTTPVYTTFSQGSRKMMVDYQSDLHFPIAQRTLLGNRFFGTLTFQSGLRDCNSDLRRLCDNDLSTFFIKNFHLVNPRDYNEYWRKLTNYLRTY